MTDLDRLPTIARGIRSKRPFQAFLAVVLLSAGAIASWAAFSFGLKTSGVVTTLLVAAALTGWGALEARAAWRPLRRHPALRALLDQPERIVWFYAVRSRSGNYVRLQLDSKKAFDLPLRRRGDTAAALAEVRPRLAHTTEGYSLDRLQTYLRSPTDLRLPHTE